MKRLGYFGVFLLAPPVSHTAIGRESYLPIANLIFANSAVLLSVNLDTLFLVCEHLTKYYVRDY